VAISGVVSQQDLGHAFGLGHLISNGGAAFAGDQHVDVTTDRFGSSQSVQGRGIQVGVVVFSNN